MKSSKRFREIKKRIDTNKKYSIEEAVKLLTKNATAKFDESVEVHIRTGIDPKQADQLVRGTVVLPHGTGKEKKIAVFAEGEKAQEAKDAGADLVGGQELIDKIKQTKEANFDIAVATPDVMKKLAVIAKVLGPKGLMPSPKTDTVTMDVKKTVEQLKKGKISFKNDDTGNIHQLVGKISFGDEKIKENIAYYIQTIKESRPSGVKGDYLKDIVITSTMGAGIKVNL